jgi:uncharacterized protein (TIGR02246 family)
MTTDNRAATDQAQIRTLMDRRAEAVRAKDLDSLLTTYTADVVTFDVISPLRTRGSAAVRQRAAEWFASFNGPLGYEVRDLSITTSDAVAFCHSLNGVNAMKSDGTRLEMWWRATVCFRKIGDQWMVTHEHSSVPFDVVTGKASLALKP